MTLWSTVTARRPAGQRWALIQAAMEDQASGAMHVDSGTKGYNVSAFRGKHIAAARLVTRVRVAVSLVIGRCLLTFWPVARSSSRRDLQLGPRGSGSVADISAASLGEYPLPQTVRRPSGGLVRCLGARRIPASTAQRGRSGHDQGLPRAGANAGLGIQAARVLAAHGATVVLACRT
jgi:hypothetical protein